jgi:hypothetical protein
MTALPGVAPWREIWSANRNGKASATSFAAAMPGASSSTDAGSGGIDPICARPFCVVTMSVMRIAHVPMIPSTATATSRAVTVAGDSRMRSLKPVRRRSPAIR